jgi:hypothetical protein
VRDRGINSRTPESWAVLGEFPASRPLLGWRSWRLLPGERLAALAERHGEWQQPTIAACRRLQPYPFTWPPLRHEAPHPYCSCGLYAYFDRRDAEAAAARLRPEPQLIVGQVRVWGRVLTRAGELRAQFGEVEGLARETRPHT